MAEHDTSECCKKPRYFQSQMTEHRRKIITDCCKREKQNHQRIWSRRRGHHAKSIGLPLFIEEHGWAHENKNEAQHEKEKTSDDNPHYFGVSFSFLQNVLRQPYANGAGFRDNLVAVDFLFADMLLPRRVFVDNGYRHVYR